MLRLHFLPDLRYTPMILLEEFYAYCSTNMDTSIDLCFAKCRTNKDLGRGKGTPNNSLFPMHNHLLSHNGKHGAELW